MTTILRTLGINVTITWFHLILFDCDTILCCYVPIKLISAAFEHSVLRVWEIYA